MVGAVRSAGAGAATSVCFEVVGSGLIFVFSLGAACAVAVLSLYFGAAGLVALLGRSRLIILVRQFQIYRRINRLRRSVKRSGSLKLQQPRPLRGRSLRR